MCTFLHGSFGTTPASVVSTDGLACFAGLFFAGSAVAQVPSVLAGSYFGLPQWLTFLLLAWCGMSKRLLNLRLLTFTLACSHKDSSFATKASRELTVQYYYR